ncbi:hypothetical protein KSP35_02815 [Aquihabitans sp. G128]|uniref:hypothetical protein n=1 Tax=Aquihabitans sp. G128 TaxID=2849779 RepID=UPI001C21EF7F|nr:hypothetical protein [Aquihabitans sp. G128]QXC61787.1 hypothetical protein KSP35_02815 [Aquihabitans sp. G128]
MDLFAASTSGPIALAAMLAVTGLVAAIGRSAQVRTERRPALVPVPTRHRRR